MDHFKQSGFHYEQEVLREHVPPSNLVSGAKVANKHPQLTTNQNQQKHNKNKQIVVFR